MKAETWKDLLGNVKFLWEYKIWATLITFLLGYMTGIFTVWLVLKHEVLQWGF